MNEVLKVRPSLDEHDFRTLRELYTQAQNWARHYEMLVVSTNVLLVSASTLFVGLAWKDTASFQRSVVFLGLPILLSGVGFALTRTLFSLYAACIERLIRYENLLNCYDNTKLIALDSTGSFLEPSLRTLPVKRPASVKFFISLHLLLASAYAGLILVMAYTA